MTFIKKINKIKLNDENIHKGYLILINPDNLLKTNEIKLISYSEKYKKGCKKWM